MDTNYNITIKGVGTLEEIITSLKFMLTDLENDNDLGETYEDETLCMEIYEN